MRGKFIKSKFAALGSVMFIIMDKLKVFCMLVLVFILAGCANQEDSALEVIHKYMDAYNNNDMTTMYACYDPDLQTVSQSLTDSFGDLVGLSNGYDTALAMGGLLQNFVQDYMEMDMNYEFVEVQESEFSDNTGYVEAKYNAIVTLESYDYKLAAEALLKFNLVKKNDSWYISNVMEEQLTSDEELQMKIEKLYNEMAENEIRQAEIKIEKAKAEGLSKPTRKAYPFSDEKAWVSGEEIDESWVCIDVEGKVMFSLEKGKNPSSIHDGFINGVGVIVEPNEDVYYLINDAGEVVVDLAEYTVLDIDLSEGLILVCKESDTFEGGTWTEIGIINTKGEWELPLTKEHIFLDEYGNLRMGDFYYCGDGVYRVIDYYGPDAIMFNYETGDTFEFDISEDEYFYYDNGYAPIVVNGKISAMDTSGNLREIVFGDGLNAEEAYYELGKYSEGLFYVNGTGKFYDIEGNVKIDLSQYPVEENRFIPLPYFDNGYALITFENEYFTIIDTQGNFMFEPMKSSGFELIMSDGMLSYYTPEGQGYTIDMEGNVLFENAFEFNDGYALVETDEGCYFINKQGERIF